jgi:hypothetical protein
VDVVLDCRKGDRFETAPEGCRMMKSWPKNIFKNRDFSIRVLVRLLEIK